MSLSVFKQKIDGQERYGYKNEKGEVVIKPQYNSAFEFNDGLALTVTFGSNKFRFINEKGENKILLGGCTDAKSFKNGLAIAKFNNKWAIIDNKGNNLTGFIFKDENQANINNMHQMADLIRKNGAKALNWANAEMLVDTDNYKILKQALKLHLQDLVQNIDESKVNDPEQFKQLVQNELDKFNNIRNKKLELLNKKDDLILNK